MQQNPILEQANLSQSSLPTESYAETVESANQWIKDHASNYDFCVVFPAEKGDFTERGKGYVEKFIKLGYEIFVYKNLRKDSEIVVLLRVPLEKLRAYADNIDLVMMLDPKEVEDQLAAGEAACRIEPVTIAHRPDITPYLPHQYIYGKYSRKIDEKLYWKEDGESHPFRELIRLKLAALILESRVQGSQNLKIRRYLRNGWLKAVFPLHDRQKTELLEYKMNQYPKQKLPLDDIKEYFGEKIALYFAFTEHSAKWLLFPAIIGLPLQVAVFAMNDYNAPFLPVFSVLIALWAVFMLELWKRKEKTIAMVWGTLGFEETEVDRPDFQGETIDSFIDGSQIRYFPSKTRSKYLFQSFMGILTMVLLVVGVVVSIYVLRYAVSPDVGDSNAQTIASIANALQIQIINYIYSFVANALAERENHRTNTEFEDSMITKIFLFQFVNSYASFFFLAFVAEHFGDCPESGCMSVLAINLAIIFGSRLATGNLMELLIPYLSYQYKYSKQMLLYGDKISRPEKEHMLDPYDSMASSLEDYAELAIQFGYTAMFVTALPCAALFACVSTMVEIKGDGWKLLNLHQRPFPKGAEDIGMWQSIFLMIAVIAVVTNAGLTVFTMSVLDDYSEVFRYWVFILFQWVVFAFQAFIMEAIPDIPEEIEIQLERTDFIVRKLIDKVGDDIEDDIVGEDLKYEFQEYPLVGGKFTHDSHFITGNMH